MMRDATSRINLPWFGDTNREKVLPNYLNGCVHIVSTLSLSSQMTVFAITQTVLRYNCDQISPDLLDHEEAVTSFFCC